MHPLQRRLCRGFSVIASGYRITVSPLARPLLLPRRRTDERLLALADELDAVCDYAEARTRSTRRRARQLRTLSVLTARMHRAALETGRATTDAAERDAVIVAELRATPLVERLSWGWAAVRAVLGLW